MEKKVPSLPFFRHPAAPPETEIFFRLAWGVHCGIEMGFWCSQTERI